MNLRNRFVLIPTLVALLGLTAVGASAETQMRGNFTLPEQAYWGSTLLPAGDYSLTLVMQPVGINLVYVRGEGVTATMLAAPNGAETPVHSCLKLDDINGTYVIRELDAGNSGRSFRFAVSKHVRDLTMRGSVAKPVTVPLSANGGL